MTRGFWKDGWTRAPVHFCHRAVCLQMAQMVLGHVYFTNCKKLERERR